MSKSILDGLFEQLESLKPVKVSYYAVEYNGRDNDWIVVFMDAKRFFSYPVISHHATELEAYFEAKRKNRELTEGGSIDDNE